MDGKPILSCSTLAVRADGHEIYTLEGLQEEAADFVGFMRCDLCVLCCSMTVDFLGEFDMGCNSL